VDVPDEPSNILWENIELPTSARVLRKIFVILMIILVLMASVVLIFYMKTIDDEIPNDKECQE
jgi:hypothetical protein